MNPRRKREELAEQLRWALTEARLLTQTAQEVLAAARVDRERVEVLIGTLKVHLQHVEVLLARAEQSAADRTTKH